MKKSSYSIGLDFGTESLRALIVDVKTGIEKFTAIYKYPDSVITDRLPETSIFLGRDWALQNPTDWFDGLIEVVPRILSEGKITLDSIVGIGVSFTSCTILPTKEDGTPLCFTSSFREKPHAWPKLWKHHAAQQEADQINELAASRCESWLKRYSGRISSEWVFPKALQMLKESPDCFMAADKIIEGGDWIVWMLIGEEKRSACQAGYKALWSREEGYPDEMFLESLHPGFGKVLEKLGSDIYPAGTYAGGLKGEIADKLSLLPGTPVGVAIIDAHATVPGTSVVEPGCMVLDMGTSTCHMVLSENEIFAEGIAGVVKDGIIPGFFGYESGQSAVGDIFAWVTRYGLPESYYNESNEQGLSIHQILTEKASKQNAGDHGLLAMDWLNGNRSVLMNADLTGLLIGLTLNTKPEDIYRAMIEATAFGTRKIIDTYEQNGIKIEKLYACGGLAKDNPFVLQTYADITGMPIYLAGSFQATALGAAMMGAVAAGFDRGGYDCFIDAAKHMAGKCEKTFEPDKTNNCIYEKIYQIYLKIHDYFGKKNHALMKELKGLTGIYNLSYT